MAEIWLPKHLRKSTEKSTFVYFVNANGHIIIPPVKDGPVPRGFQKTEIPTKHSRAVERISRKFADQKRQEWDRLDAKKQYQVDTAEQRVMGSMRRLIASSSTSQREKDQLRYAMSALQERRKLRVVKQEVRLHMESYEAPLRG